MSILASSAKWILYQKYPVITLREEMEQCGHSTPDALLRTVIDLSSLRVHIHKPMIP